MLPITNLQEARIPMEYWEQGWIFKAIEDLCWRVITRNAPNVFPQTLRYPETQGDPGQRSHHGYMLREIGNYALELCPLTSRTQQMPYIPKGAVLQQTNHVMDKQSYLVLNTASILPRNNKLFPEIPRFLGVFPLEQLQN